MKSSKWSAFIRQAKRWLKPPRTLRITRAGWQYIGLTLIVGFAAINTANNLLYLIFGLMLSFITTSGVLSELTLRKIALTRRFPKHLFAGQAAPVALDILNAKKRIASLSLLIEDLSQQNAAGHRRYVLKIAPQQTHTLTYPATFPQRGLHLPGKIRISTRYPFGFFLKSTTFTEVDETVLVYPKVERLSSSEQASLAFSDGEAGARRKGGGEEFYGIREYVPGDTLARISWKSTARTSKMMVREFELDRKKQILVVLDITPPSPLPPDAAERMERAISVTASYLMFFSKHDYTLQLATPAEASPPDKGEHHLFLLLRMLALLQPPMASDQPRFAATCRSLLRRDVISLCVSINSAPEGRFSKVILIR